jgi:MFS family permease
MDVAVDGLMIDMVGENEMGLASSLTNGGSVIGGCASGFLFSWTLMNWSFSTNVVMLLGVSLLVTAFVLVTKERPDDDYLSLKRTATSCRKRLPFKKIAYLLSCRMSRAKAVTVMLLSFFIFFGFSVIALTFNAELIQKGGWTSFELSRLQSTLGLVSGTLGAFAMGKLVDRYGYRAVLAVSLVTMSGFFSLMALMPNQLTPFYITVLTVAPGLVFVALVPGVMEVSRGAVAATSFTLCMTLMNFGGIAGSTISDFIFTTIPKSGVFAAESALFLAALALVAIPSARFSLKAKKYAPATIVNTAPNPA